MGFFASLFGHKKEKKSKKETLESTQKSETGTADTFDVSPETAAIITAAAYAMFSAENPGLAFKITRVSKEWQLCGRQKLMDSYKI